MVMWLLMWWGWTPPPAKLTHCWRCGSWWCGPCPLEPSFPPQTPSLKWTLRGDPMSLIQEFNDLPFRRRALKNICWLGYTHVSSVPAWKKTSQTTRFQNFRCFTFGIEDFCLSMGSGKGWFGAGVWKFTIFVNLQHSGRRVFVAVWLRVSFLDFIAKPVLGQGASYCVGQGPQRSLMKGWGRPPGKFSSNFWESYFSFLKWWEYWESPGWGIQTHAPSCAHPSWILISSENISRLYIVDLPWTVYLWNHQSIGSSSKYYTHSK